MTRLQLLKWLFSWVCRNSVYKNKALPSKAFRGLCWCESGLALSLYMPNLDLQVVLSTYDWRWALFCGDWESQHWQILKTICTLLFTLLEGSRPGLDVPLTDVQERWRCVCGQWHGLISLGRNTSMHPGLLGLHLMDHCSVIKTQVYRQLWKVLLFQIKRDVITLKVSLKL